MTAGTPSRTVATALADIERWKADEEARHKAERVEVEQEIKNLETAISNLQSQLDALSKFRTELDGKAAALGGLEVQRAYGALFDALADQAKRVAGRERLVATKLKERGGQLAAKLATGEVAEQVAAYRDFRENGGKTLASLPEMYRRAVVEMHDGVVRKLRTTIASLTAEAVQVDAEPIEVDVVYAVDAPEGTAELLVLVLPVDEAVHAQWHDREDGLQLWIAARVVQAVHESAAATGFVRAQPLSGGHRGLLVIEVDLAGSSDPFVGAVEKRLGEVLGSAAELAGAGVRVLPRKVPVDYVLPPDDGGEGE